MRKQLTVDEIKVMLILRTVEGLRKFKERHKCSYISGVKGLQSVSLKVDIPLLLQPASGCLSSSDVEEAVQEEEPHFLLTVFGMLQLSRYLIGRYRREWLEGGRGKAIQVRV